MTTLTENVHLSSLFKLKSGCEAKCLEEFLFPDKNAKLQIRCEDNVWKASGFDQVPDCERKL